MRDLPFDLRFALGEHEIHLVHGSPRKVNEYLSEDKPATLYERLAAAETARSLVFGHTHKPWVREYGGVLFINCGSVGKPKDGDPRGLFAIILMFGPVSGGHFNPVVSLVDASFGGLAWRDALAYVPAQIAGCISGAIAANGMFALTAITISTHHRASGAHLFAEVIATL